MRRILAIAVRSVKAGMTRFEYLHGVHVGFGALGVRNLSRSIINSLEKRVIEISVIESN